MNPVEKLSMVVKSMHGGTPSYCNHLGALMLVIDRECEPSPELDALREQVQKMRVQTRELCGSYDVLRSLTGALELSSCVEPQFYVYCNAGNEHKDFCPVDNMEKN